MSEDRRRVHVDQAAEAALLGCVLSVPETFLDVVDTITSDDFGVAAHRHIWEAIVSVEAQAQPIDQITVAAELERQKALKKAGGRDYLASLAGGVEEAGSAVAYAGIVAEKATLRRVAHAGSRITQAALASDAVAADVVDFAESAVLELGEQRTGHRYQSMPEAVSQMMREMAERRGSDLLGISTGFQSLDRMTGGFQKGQLITLAARPGQGKSALSLAIARYAAETTGEVVVLESYEMSNSELMLRMLSNITGLPMQDLMRGNIPPQAERDVSLATERMIRLSLLVDDKPPATIAGLRSALRRQARRSPLGLVVVDYLQLISGTRTENRTQEVSEITRTLKLLAQELEVPILALSQLSRAVEQRADRRPTLSDLRESGSIEQDSDIVIFIAREHTWNPAADPGAAELIVAKQRNGPTGTINMRWNGQAARFIDEGEVPY